MNDPVEIVDYDPQWPQVFAILRDDITAALGGLAHRIEHVGSTAVPGMAAKPIIDMTIVIDTRNDLPAVINSLQTIGYRHEGDLGIPGREAFASPTAPPAHHLYVCAANNENLARVLAFRDFLRTHPDAARTYATLKRSLAQRFRIDRVAYTASKTTFINEVLATAMPESPPPSNPNHVTECRAFRQLRYPTSPEATVGTFLLGWFGKMKMIEIGPGEIRTFLHGLQRQGISPATRARCKTVLSAIFTAALQDQVVFRHPCTGVKTATQPQRPLRILTPEEYQQVREAMDPQWRVCLDVLIETGVRWASSPSCG